MQKSQQALINKDGEFFVVDKSGNKIGKPRAFDKVYCFDEGLASVVKDKKYSFIDKTDKVIISLEYDEVWVFSKGLAKVGKNNKYGFIDETGEIVMEYDDIDCYFRKDNTFFVKNMVNG